MARITKEGAVRFTSPADPVKKPRAASGKMSKDHPSPHGYTVCKVCGHTVGLKRATWTDTEAVPRVFERKTLILVAHNPEGRRTRGGRVKGFLCFGTDTVATNPIFKNPE